MVKFQHLEIFLTECEQSVLQPFQSPPRTKRLEEGATELTLEIYSSTLLLLRYHRGYMKFVVLLRYEKIVESYCLYR